MRILTISFWDTRRFLVRGWKHNLDIIRHNFEVMNRTYWSHDYGPEVEHHIFLNERVRTDGVRELGRELGELHIWDANLDGADHLVVWNLVAQNAYYKLGYNYMDTFTGVFTLNHDLILANHTDYNWFEVMEHMLEDKLFDQITIRDGKYESMGHTVGDKPMSRYRHNASVCRGYYRTSILDEVWESVFQSERASECHLGHRLGVECQWMHCSDLLYNSDYHLDTLTADKAENLLRYAQDQKLTAHIPEIRHA